MAAHRPRETRPGVVSVVTINYRGADDTIACLTGLGSLDWPADRLEIICVENASGDDSAERIRAGAPPEVRLIESPLNTGFTGGCNLGVANATGEYVAFLNNDARPDRRWLAAAVEALEQDPGIGCVACKVLDWEGETVDYVDGALTWYGMGYKPECTQRDKGLWEEPKDVLFATGSAMVMRAALFREIGGFDERFFMFYDDVDLGWRLNLLGHRVRYVPTSIAYHRHHASIDKFGSWRERYLLERNALLCLYKNLEDTTLAGALAPAMALAIRRTIALGGDDPTVLDLQRSPGGDDVDHLQVSKTTMTGAYAVDYFVEQLPSLEGTRRALQAARRRTDVELFPLFRNPMIAANTNQRYVAGYDALVAAFDIAELYSTGRRFAPQSAGTDGPAAADLLEEYRAGSAARAERITQLVRALDAAKSREAGANRRLEKSQATVARLRARTERLQARIARLEARPAPPTPAPAPGVGVQARKLAKQVARRLKAGAENARASGKRA